MPEAAVTPRVSVCVPTYNYGNFIADCIESVLAQTMTDWELIICDDCSTDDTAEIVECYSQSDHRIKYIRNGQRLGMNGNIKRVTDLGRGKYLKVLCSDDWIAEQCLEVMCDFMDRYPDVAIATCAEVNCDQDGTPLYVQCLFGKPLWIIPGEAMLDWMARGMGFGGNSSFLIRRTSYEAVGGYNDRVWYAPDYDLGARLCRVGHYLHTDQPLFYGRVHGVSSSSVNPTKLLDVHDWFEIPDRVFRPRPLGSREWWRYQVLTGYYTARYMVNTLLEYSRGHAAYAQALAEILRNEGNFVFGIPSLAYHIPVRIYNKLSGRNLPRRRPVESWMGTPRAIRNRRSDVVPEPLRALTADD